MTIRQMVNPKIFCARPLLFVTGDPDSEYAFGGTCFLVRLNGRHFVVSAHHCLGAWKYDQVRVVANVVSPRLLPFHQILVPDATASEDGEFADLMFFEFKLDSLTELERQALWPIDLWPLLDVDRQLRAGESKMAIFGYPTAFSEMDPEAKTMRREGVLIGATYQGPAQDQFCKIMLLDPEHLALVDEHQPNFSLNGFSGSPVFYVQGQREPGEFHFAGLMVRGSRESRVARFIDCRGIFRILTFLTGEDPGTGAPIIVRTSESRS